MGWVVVVVVGWVVVVALLMQVVGWCYDFIVSMCLRPLSARHVRFPFFTLWLLCAQVN